MYPTWFTTTFGMICTCDVIRPNLPLNKLKVSIIKKIKSNYKMLRNFIEFIPEYIQYMPRIAIFEDRARRIEHDRNEFQLALIT